MTWRTMRVLAQGESAALRSLVAAYGRLPACRPLTITGHPEMAPAATCGPSTGTAGYERHRRRGEDPCADCTAAAREAWRRRGAA